MLKIQEPVDPYSEVKEVTEPLYSLAKKVLEKTKGSLGQAQKVLVEEYGVPPDWAASALLKGNK